MAYREVSRIEIAQVIRRWQAGSGPQQISSGTDLSRNTVRKCLSEAKAGAVPTDDQISRLAVIGQPGPRQAETPTGCW